MHPYKRRLVACVGVALCARREETHLLRSSTPRARRRDSCRFPADGRRRLDRLRLTMTVSQLTLWCRRSAGGLKRALWPQRFMSRSPELLQSCLIT
ncbi:hypothetical protein EYF80_057377 [Liparis tanakae]|uniref:Uncharacterized protein n=1 Tax=Liparis tanakae TaxID=230148 RepID=A0A4Z2EW51_9TELE|nr:hypothetical protein EYF80_057377 [Liparis tanakae]